MSQVTTSSASRRPGILSRSRLVPWPVHPLLLAPYPILVLFAENQAEVGVGETGQPVVGAVLAVLAITLIAGALMRDLRRGALLATLLLVAWFTFYQIQLILRPLGILPDVQVALTFGLVVLLGYLVVRMPETALQRLSMGLDVIALVLLTLTLTQIVPYQLEHQVAARSVPMT